MSGAIFKLTKFLFIRHNTFFFKLIKNDNYSITLKLIFHFISQKETEHPEVMVETTMAGTNVINIQHFIIEYQYYYFNFFILNMYALVVKYF